MEEIVSNSAYYGLFSRNESMAAMEFYPDGTYLIRNSSKEGYLSLDLICSGGRFLPILFYVEEETGKVITEGASAIRYNGGIFNSFDAFISSIKVAKYPLPHDQLLRQQSSRAEFTEERSQRTTAQMTTYRSFGTSTSESKNQMEGFEEAEGVMRSIGGGLSLPSLGREGTEEAEMIFKHQDL